MFNFLPSFSEVHPISDESPIADPTSDESPPVDPISVESLTADPTFDESPLFAPAANPINTTAPEPCHSHRVSTLPSHLRDFHCFSAFTTLHEPHTFREASFDPLWQQVMKEELDALLKTNGTVDHYKARLVAKGFTQEHEIDYEETFAPVARISSARTLIAVFASQHWPLFQMDVKNVFLNGELIGSLHAAPSWFLSSSRLFSQSVSLTSVLPTLRSWYYPSLANVDDMIIIGDDAQGI
uniref:Reverse transcriptase Ty1/copia-type domain-containing protein n=1 Tax=Fagus sylvatica TaxID=28930 RepID=A0A2N9G5J3_FAGSY